MIKYSYEYWESCGSYMHVFSLKKDGKVYDMAKSAIGLDKNTAKELFLKFVNSK